MKNFKRIMAIVLAVLMIVPVLTVGVNAATAQTESNNSTAGTLIAGGNWKLLSYSNGSKSFGNQYDNQSTVTTDAEGQMVAYNIAKGNVVYPYDARTVIESTNTTTIEGLYFVNSSITSSDGNNQNVRPTIMSYAFSRTLLQGTLSKDTFSATTGFVTSDCMVKDGVVITEYDSDANGTYNTMTATVYVNGAVVSTETLDCTELNMAYGQAHFFALRDGVLTVIVRDTRSSYDKTYFINGNYTFSKLDASSLLTGKDYHLCVGTGYDYNGTTGAYRSANINIARIGVCTLSAKFNPVKDTWTEDIPAKNSADWTGHGTPTCDHKFGDWNVVTTEKCFTPGKRTRECSVCHFVDVEITKETGHIWSEWQVVTDPTCTTAGSKTRKCSSCKEVETETIEALNHDLYVTDEKAAGCFTDGYKNYACTRCTYTKTETLKAKGAHTYVTTYNPYPTLTKSGTKIQTCSVCGDVTSSSVSYSDDIFYTKDSMNVVHMINPSLQPYDNTANYVADANGIKFEDLSVYMNKDYAYFPENLIMSNVPTDLCNFQFTVTPITHTFKDGTVGYPSVIGTVLTNHPEEYNDCGKTAPYSSAPYGDDTYACGFYAGQAVSADGEYTLCLNLCDNVKSSNMASYLGGVAGTANDGYYEQLTWVFVCNGGFCGHGGVTLSTPIAAGTPVTIQILREYNISEGKWVMGVYIVETDEYIILSSESYDILPVEDTEYYFGVMAYGYDTNKSTASFKLSDICSQNPTVFNGYTHTHTYDAHFENTTATCKEAAYEYDMCTLCGDITNYVEYAPKLDYHTYDGTNNICPVCNADIYTVVNGKAYDSFDKGYNVVKDGETLLLIKNYTPSDTIVIDKNITLDMGVKNIKYTSNDDTDRFDLIKIKANVTVNMDSGSYIRIDYNNTGAKLFTVESGSLTINDNGSASYVRARSGGESGALIEANGTSTVTVNGGTWYERVADLEHHTPLFVANDSAVINLNGTTVYTNPTGADIAYATTKSGKIVGKSVAYNTSYVYNTLVDTKTNKLTGDAANFTVTAASTEPGVKVDNYNVTIMNMTGINAIRYAQGDYNTVSDIKAAPDCYTLSASKLVKVDDGYMFELKDGGKYSMWVRGNEGEFIFKVDATKMTQTLSSYDLKLTINNLYGVSQLQYANGNCTTYAEVKSNRVFVVDAAKLVGLKSYTYSMPKAGDITVYVKYTDTTRPAEFLHFTLTTPMPEVTQDGRNVTITALNNIKCVRRVYGTYTTLAQVKAAGGVVYAKSVFGGKDSYTFNVPKEGAVTFSLQYNSGYTKIINITVVQKKPTFNYDSSKKEVTFGNLDDLYFIRYAKGTYTKANAVKAAEGCVTLRNTSIIDGKITIRNLTKGKYTFVVQYNEQSQNLYYVTVD